MQIHFDYYLLSTLSNIYYLECARKGPLHAAKLSWTREIFDCGYKFIYVSLSSHVKDYAAMFLTFDYQGVLRVSILYFKLDRLVL